MRFLTALLLAVALLFTCLYNDAAGKNKKSGREQKKAERKLKKEEPSKQYEEDKAALDEMLQAKEKILRCPICNNKISLPTEQNLEDYSYAKDMDRCRYDKNFSPYLAPVFLCTQCGYSAFGSSFYRDVYQDIRVKVETQLTKRTREAFAMPLAESVKPTDKLTLYQIVPSVIKFDNAIVVCKWKESHKHELALLALNAAWLCRSKLLELPEIKDMEKTYSSVKRLINKDAGDKDVWKNPQELISICRDIMDERFHDKKLTFREAVAFWTILAGHYDRFGRTGGAKQALEFAYKTATQAERDDIDKEKVLFDLRKKATLFVEEMRYIQEASDNFKIAIKNNEYTSEYIPLTLYRIGELQRRLGNIDQAYRYFNATLKIAPVESDAAQMAKEQLQFKEFKDIKDEPSLPKYDEELLATLIEKAPKKPAVIGEKELVRDICEEYLDHIWTALAVYKEKNDEFPSSLPMLIKKGYTKDSLVNEFICPETKRPFTYIKPPKNDEFYSITPMVFDSLPHKIGGKSIYFVLYADGHIGTSEKYPEDED